MDLALTADQVSLQQMLRKLFSDHASAEQVRKSEQLGFDPELWRVLVDTGITSIAVTEGHDGGGGTTEDLVIVCREAGRRVAPVPLPAVFAAIAVLDGLDTGADLLPGIASGDTIPVLVPVPVVAGQEALVPAGAVARLAVVLDGDELVLLRRTGDAAPLPNLGSEPITRLDASWSRDRVLATGESARTGFEHAVQLWRLLTAAALDGLRQEALRMVVDYVKARKAFGVQLGWFQAVQHRLADQAVLGEAVELLVDEAAWAADSGDDRAAELATMAFLSASESAFQTCRASLQFHGGYGYTLEYDIQLYFRRAKAWPLAGGAPRQLWRSLGDTLFAGERLEGLGL